MSGQLPSYTHSEILWVKQTLVKFKHPLIKCFICVLPFRIYYCILDGAEVNRQFIKLHFADEDEIIENCFIANNVFNGKPMVFIMDPKVNFVNDHK